MRRDFVATRRILSMKCNQCGAEAPSQAAFCPQCGAQLGKPASGAGNRPPAAARLQSGIAQGSSRDVPEAELWTGAYSPKAMTAQFILGGAIVVAAAVAAAVFNSDPFVWSAIGISALLIFGYLGLLLLYQRLSIQYQLTTHRLVVQRGIVNRTDDRILLVDIDDITVHQNLFDRLFGIGTITLHTSDETTREKSPDPDHQNRGILHLRGIENPRHVGDLIDESRRAERSRRGVYMMDA
jgi:membrane protein YdbS with pleckstrin-like domain